MEIMYNEKKYNTEGSVTNKRPQVESNKLITQFQIDYYKRQ